jgi:hypothetical protein
MLCPPDSVKSGLSSYGTGNRGVGETEDDNEDDDRDEDELRGLLPALT